jgi:hypothetical protein
MFHPLRTVSVNPQPLAHASRSISVIAFGLLLLGGASFSAASVSDGYGIITENTNIEAGASYSPSNSENGYKIGTQTFEKNLNFEAGSIFTWNLTGHWAYTVYDKVNVSGDLTGSDVIFKVVSDESYTDTSYRLNFWDEEHYWHDVFSDGSDENGIDRWTWMFSSIQSEAPLTKGHFDFRHNALHWSPVPEPSGALAGLLLLGGVLRRRRLA